MDSPLLLKDLNCSSGLLHPGLPVILDERLKGPSADGVDPTSAAGILGVLANVLNNACAGHVVDEYDGGSAVAMQDSVRVAATVAAWLSGGRATALATAGPATCSSLQVFVSAAFDLASQVFFSREWREQLAAVTGRYVAVGNAVRSYVRDLAPAVLDATEACWQGVEQQAAAGNPSAEELRAACRALFGALFEGLRVMSTVSAERINDNAVPRDMRSFAGLNILWTALNRAVTGLSPTALAALLEGAAVQSVLRSLLGYLQAYVRALPALAPGPPQEYEQWLKLAKFWLQHIGRIAQTHPAAAAACWAEAAAAGVQMYGTRAASAAAIAAAAGASGPEAEGERAARERHLADLEGGMAARVTSVLAVSLDACEQPAEALGAWIGALERSATAAPPPAPGGPAPHALTGPVLLAAALLQRAAAVRPETRAAMGARLLPWLGYGAAVHVYGTLPPNNTSACSAPSAPAPPPEALDLPHQLSTAALALALASCEEAQARAQQAAGLAALEAPGGSLDAQTLAAVCAVACNWGASAHPLLALCGSDVLCTLAAHADPALASRLVAAVARLAALASAAEAAAGVAHAGPGAAVPVAGLARRLQRLLCGLLAAAAPEAEPAWREVLTALQNQQQQQAGGSSGSQGKAQDALGTSAPPSDVCGAAAARALWAASAAAARGPVAPSDGTAALLATGGSVTEGELTARARQLFAGVKQAMSVLGSCNTAAASASAAGSEAAAAAAGAASAAALARQWMAQLLGCVEATVLHHKRSGCTALQPLLAEAAGLAAEALQLPALSADVAFPPQPPQPGPNGGPAPTDSAGAASAAAAAHAAVRVLATAAEALQPAALAAAVPALTRLAVAGGPALAADIAAVAVQCKEPPQEALFHALHRCPHAAVQHATWWSHVQLCRTVPTQHKAAVRGLFPPEAMTDPGAVPPALLAVIKSYVQLKPTVEDLAAAAAAGGLAVAGGPRLEAAAREACLSETAPARVAAREGVRRGLEAMQGLLQALALAPKPKVPDGFEADGMALDGSGRPGPGGPRGGPNAPGGPLGELLSDSRASVSALSAALGGAERSLQALVAALRGGPGGGPAPGLLSRPTDEQAVQVHVRGIMGDLSSAGSRLRGLSELLCMLQGRG